MRRAGFGSPVFRFATLFSRRGASASLVRECAWTSRRTPATLSCYHWFPPGSRCAGAVGNQSSASVTARIIDARTGKAPRGSEVRVRITDGDYRQEQSATAVSDSLSIDVGPWRMGVYDVVIVAPSYAPWHVRNVIVGVDHCNSAQAALVRAFLLPAGRVLAP